MNPLNQLANILQKIKQYDKKKLVLIIIAVLAGLFLAFKLLGFVAEKLLFSPFISLKLVLFLLLLALTALLLCVHNRALSMKVIDRAKSKLPVLHYHAQKHYTIINTHATNWIERFKTSSPKERWRMTGKPLFLLIALFLVFKFGNLFFPPKIVSVTPGNQSTEVPLDAKIEITFSKSVIKLSAEKNLDISPATKGTFGWEGDQKLIFTPKKSLARATAYTVNFNGTVLSNFFIPLTGNKPVRFQTAGNPKVILASPQTEALEDFSPVTVIFDRPMIALTTATNSAIKQPAFEISPRVEGEGRWLGTTAYQFRPSESFRKATTYKVTVPAGLHSQDEGYLQSAYAWQFSSERPKVDDISPQRDYDFASPTGSVSATFSQDVDPDSINEKFVLYDKNYNKVPGKIIVTGKTAGFYADEPLHRQEHYTAVLNQGIQSTEGENGMEDNYTWSFGVAAYPAAISSDPANGQKNVSEQYGINVLFRTPMDEASFDDNVTIDPQPETKPDMNFSAYNNRNSLYINSYFGRSKEYTITVGAGAKDQYGVALGKTFSFSFTTSAYNPSVSIYPFGTYFGAFNQQIIPRVVAQVINAEKINYTLYKLKREDLLDLYRRRYEQQCKDQACSSWQDYDTSKLEKVRSWSETFSADLNSPVNVVTKVTANNGEKLSSGFYFLNLQIPQGAHDNMVMIVSKSTLTVKKSNKQIFSWSVNQTSNNVIPGMKMQLTDSSGNILSEGNTNDEGVFMKDVDLNQKNNLFVFGEKDDDTVVAASAWSDDINIYDFGLPSYYNSNESKNYDLQQSYKLYLTLDRPIYRPGQKVYFKGVIRKDNDGAYENLAPGEKVKVTINDADSRSVYSQDLPVTSFGSFSGDFVLSKDAGLGYYQLGSSFQGNSFNQPFQVEEYKKPELAVTVKPSKDAYIQGDHANININASYYFGAPVTNAPVAWTLQRQDFSFQWAKDWRFEFGDPDSYWSRPWWYFSGASYYSGEQVTEGKSKTDAKGDLELSLPMDISKQKTSQTMTVEAEVNDNSNQSIAGSTEFTVNKAAIYAGLRPVSYGNQSGKEAQVEVVTVDPKGNEIPNTPVAVEFYKRTWETVREKNPDDGMFYYTSKPSDSLVSDEKITTDSLGRGKASFTPEEGGTYKVVGKVSDKNGNQNVCGSFLWVSGFGFSTARENNDRIVLVTDKRDYLVGENMSVFVASPFASTSARTLLTAERGSVLDYKVVDTSETSNNFKMPVPQNYTPNAFIGAVLIKGGDQVKNPPEFKMGYTEIKVTDKKQQIEVSITTDKKKYKPKDTLKATIETKDLLGNPVSTELAVGLVDKAVWDLSMVNLPDIYQTFYQPRNLEVATSQLLTISIDRINANTNLGAKGGSGGGGGGGNDTSRTNFPDTAYWNPALMTDANGKAEIEIQLPDNLTTWKLSAVANSQAAAFGSNSSEVIVSRDVLIRPFLPRFLSVGDEAKLGAIIVNTSGQDQTITAKVEAEGIQINEDHAKEQVIADGAQAKFTWNTVAGNVKTAKIKLSASAGQSVKDAVETTLPVKSYSIPETVAAAGQAKNNAQEKIVLPKEIDTTQGQASLTFSPSLGSASIDSLSYLADYPYYCTEQITSKFMPAVFVHRILTSAKIDKSGTVDSAQLEQMINDGVQRLNNQQHADGGWGWWTEYETSDPFLTAYAFLGLAEAKKDRFTVADQTLQKAQNYLVGQLARGDKNTSLDTQAYILYALRGRGLNLTAYASNLYDRHFELSLESRAYLAMAMKDMGMGQANQLLNELIGMAKKTATTTHWEAKQDYRFMGSNITTTASILEALTTFDKNNPLIPEVIRYLMSTRIDDHWSSTRDTAAVIKAVSLQLLGSGDQNVNENYKLSLNGKALKENNFTKEDLLNFDSDTVPVSQFKTGESNDLQIAKSGVGNLYYNINLKYYLPFSEIKPLEQGMVVEREFVDSKGKILPSDTIAENTEVWVRLIIVAPEERHFVVIEDTLPAGLESVNESLKNVSVLNKEAPGLKAKGDQLLYFSHKEYHDDRTTLFADYLPPGVYEVSYRVRATTPGRYHYPPAQAYQMYTPDVSGHSSGGWLEVKE